MVSLYLPEVIWGVCTVVLIGESSCIVVLIWQSQCCIVVIRVITLVRLAVSERMC